MVIRHYVLLVTELLIYKVGQVVVDLGWVDFDLIMPSSTVHLFNVTATQAELSRYSLSWLL